MSLDFKVMKQWFFLLLGNAEIQQLSSQWIIDKLTSLTYPEKEIWIKGGIYIPSAEVLQLIAVVPSVEYGEAKHLTKEQYVRVMTQGGFLAAFLSSRISDVMKQKTSGYNESVYYVQETTRWRRLVRPDDPFVFTVRVQNVREVGKSGDMIFSIDVADGPFEGNIRAAYLPGHSQAIASEGLEQFCQSIWQTLVGNLASKIAFMLVKRQLNRATEELASTDQVVIVC